MVKSIVIFALTSWPTSCLSRPNVFHFDYGPVSTKGVDEFFEGDMKLTDDQLEALKRGSLEPRGDLGKVKARRTPKANGIIDTKYRWPSNTVKFELAPELSEGEKSLVRSTLRKLQEKLNSCIRFVESSNGDRVYVKNNGNGCWSDVGYQTRMRQTLNLQSGWDGCMNPYTIEHEFLHAIGLYHTQSRSDRDKYVEIVWINIPKDKQYNFKKYSDKVVNHFNLPYDYESVMHYQGEDFGVAGRQTITTLDRTKQWVIGRGDGVSAGDIELVKRMYSCDGNTGPGGDGGRVTTGDGSRVTTGRTTGRGGNGGGYSGSHDRYGGYGGGGYGGYGGDGG